MALVLRGLTTRLGSVRRTAKELSLEYGRGNDLDRPEEKTGITALHRFAPHENILDMSAECVRYSLQEAGVRNDNVGGLVAASNFTHPTLIPTYGPAVAAMLGLDDRHAVTIGTGCGGLAQAVQHAAAMMTSSFAGWPRSKACVVLVGDEFSRHVDTDDLKCRYLFSDGVASFVLIEAHPRPGDFVLKMVNSRSVVMHYGHDALVLRNSRIDDSDPYFRMKTRPIANFVEDRVLDVAYHMLALEEGERSGISLIPHQANRRLLEKMRWQERGAASMYVDGISRIGNTALASTLFGLEDALARDLLATDDIVLVPFGAEWVVGVIRLYRQRS